MTDFINQIKEIKQRLDNCLARAEANLSDTYDGIDDMDRLSIRHNTEEEIAHDIEDAVLDLKMTVYMHDCNSPLYEAIHNLPSEYSGSLYIPQYSENLQRVLYLIDKVILFYSDPE